MAEHRGVARNHPPEQPVEPADIFAAGHLNDRARRLCLDAGRALALCGVLVAIPPAFHPADGAAAVSSSTRAFIGFVLWIVGACLCLLALTPAAPMAARAGAAAATTVLRRLSSPLMN